MNNNIETPTLLAEEKIKQILELLEYDERIVVEGIDFLTVEFIGLPSELLDVFIKSKKERNG